MNNENTMKSSAFNVDAANETTPLRPPPAAEAPEVVAALATLRDAEAREGAARANVDAAKAEHASAKEAWVESATAATRKEVTLRREDVELAELRLERATKGVAEARGGYEAAERDAVNAELDYLETQGATPGGFLKSVEPILQKLFTSIDAIVEGERALRDAHDKATNAVREAYGVVNGRPGYRSISGINIGDMYERLGARLQAHLRATIPAGAVPRLVSNGLQWIGSIRAGGG